MKIQALKNRLRWINLPGAILMILLQRIPVVTVGTLLEEMVMTPAAGTLLKSAVATVAALGAVNTMVGATPLVPSAGTANGITVNAGTAVSVVYTVNGTQTPPQSWSVSGSIPAGLNFSGLTSAGTVNIQSLQLSGTPTVGGLYPVSIQAFEFANGTGIGSPVYTYTINVNGNANAAPAFTTQPSSQTITVGGAVSFTAAASGTPAPTFQWRKDGNDIGGATAGTFSIGSVAAGDAGNYTVVATNSQGSATSNAATLTVSAALAAPAFTTQPASQTASVGAMVTLNAAASGNPAPTFQWRKGGANIAGANSSSFPINSVAAGDAGDYTVVATNSQGSVTSNVATLTVNALPAAPVITTQPAGKTATAGTSVNFSVTATGNPAPTYQWRKDGTDIGGATASSYSIASVISADAGGYAVVVTNSQGSVTSNTATLTIGVAAGHQPAAATVTSGHSASFSAGNTAGAIQWQISTDNGATWRNLANDATYSGVDTATLVVKNAGSSLNGARYRYTATGNGVVATSDGALLSVAQVFFPFPTAIAVDGAGNLYVADANADTVQKVNASSQVSALAGTSGTAGSADGTGAAARFNMPAGIALTGGVAFVADTANATIRRIATDGATTTFAGSANTRGSTDGTGTAATFSAPNGLAFDANGNLYVADSMNHTIRKITAAGAVTTFAGSAGVTGTTNGNGGAARFNLPTGVAVDSNGNVYVADTTNNTIRKITATGDVSTFAGLEGVSGSQDGTGSGAQFNHPGGLAVDGAGNLYLADTGNSLVRKVTPAGNVTTIAGLAGIAGLMDGAGADSFLNQPQAVALDGAGNLYVADTGNAAIRKITPAGAVSTLSLTAAPAPAPNPSPNPNPNPSPSPMPSGGGGGGGGGGAPSQWFVATLAALSLLRAGWRRTRRGSF